MKVLLWLKLRWKVLISSSWNLILPSKTHPGIPLKIRICAFSVKIVVRLASSFLIIWLSTIAEAQNAKESRIPPVMIF